eukprot:4279593-Pleurochrysis_carterae.AAC.1
MITLVNYVHSPYRLTEAKGGSPTYWPDLIGIVHWHHRSKVLVLNRNRNPQMELGIPDQVCISPIQIESLYDVRHSANRYYMPSDGFSTHDAHPDGSGYDSAPHSLISSMTPEYEPPAFDYLMACALSRPVRRVWYMVMG